MVSNAFEDLPPELQQQLMANAQGNSLPPQMDTGVYEKIIDNNQLIDELIMTLKGQVVNNITNEIEKVGEPIISEKALNWLIGNLLPYTSKIFSLSFLSERTVKTMLYEVEVRISTELMFPEKYGVDRQHREFIGDIINHAFTASIYKAFNGETIKRLLEQHKVTESRIIEEHQKAKFSLPGFGGGVKV